MTISLNGREKSIPIPLTVAQLAEQENIEPKGAAIAINGKIVRKAVWESTLLNEGDKVTAVKIAFGG